MCMWKLEKTSLEKAKADLDEVTSHCRNIKVQHKGVFEKLYERYDECNGSLTLQEHADFIKKYPIQAHAMKGQYAKLCEGEGLHYIREELVGPVCKCPFCGFGEPITLDHYLPESVYEELATCRLNLVPLCWTCNNKKRAKDYNGFVHAYYQEYPTDIVFFKCKVTVSAAKALLLEFYIDERVIEESLSDKLKNQINVIELNSRLHKECISYLMNNFSLDELPNDESLKFFLADKINKAKNNLGANHFQTAFLQGLYDCKEFTVEFLNGFLKKNQEKNKI